MMVILPRIYNLHCFYLYNEYNMPIIINSVGIQPLYIGLLQCVCQFASSCHRYSRLDLHQTRSNTSATRIRWPAALGPLLTKLQSTIG